jgi:4,5-DOPA dioxygenase extradiol
MMARMSTTPRVQPVGFISHGAPTLALEVGGFAGQLATWGGALRTAAAPRAIVIVSAHWATSTPRTGVEQRAPLRYDFGGFPDALRRIEYPAPADAALAADVRELIRGGAALDRPWDHGVWVPLLKMFPAADLPIVQVSLPLRSGPDGWLALGRALAPLRRDGVLILGSGGAVHNLGRLAWSQGPDAPVETWASGFDRWIADTLDRGDLAGLGRVLDDAPALALAHPTVEHLAPLLVAAGAAATGTDLPPPIYPVTGWVMGSLSMRSVQWA